MTCGRKSPFMTQTDPELRCGPILTTQMDGNPPSLQVIGSPFPQVLSARLAKYIARTLLLVAQSSSVERLVVRVRVRSLWWNMGTLLGRSQPRAGLVEIRSCSPTSPCPIAYPPEVTRRRETAVEMPLLPCLDVPAGFLELICLENSWHQVSDDTVMED